MKSNFDFCLTIMVKNMRYQNLPKHIVLKGVTFPHFQNVKYAIHVN